LLMQFSLAKHADLPDVPLIMDLAKNDEQRQMFRLIFARQTMGRPYQGPPGVPADRLRALQQAFMDTMKDKDFLAEASKANLDINPVAGDEIQKLVVDIYGTPAPVVQKALQHLQ
jgi:tripartite-type tricarboxylate transporter receptor subunit TctC